MRIKEENQDEEEELYGEGDWEEVETTTPNNERIGEKGLSIGESADITEEHSNRATETTMELPTSNGSQIITASPSNISHTGSLDANSVKVFELPYLEVEKEQEQVQEDVKEVAEAEDEAEEEDETFITGIHIANPSTTINENQNETSGPHSAFRRQLSALSESIGCDFDSLCSSFGLSNRDDDAFSSSASGGIQLSSDATEVLMYILEEATIRIATQPKEQPTYYENDTPQYGDDVPANPDSSRLTTSTKKSKKTKKQKKLIAKAAQLDSEIAAAMSSITNSWEDRYRRLLATSSRDKIMRRSLENTISVQEKQMKVLVEHVDKLMRALKIEASKRVRANQEVRTIQTETDRLNEKLHKSTMIQEAQKRAIHELNEGCKILEDQLRLMDEKFLDVRAKLDLSRNSFLSQLRKTKKESLNLRTKYALATGGGSLDLISISKFLNTGQVAYSMEEASQSVYEVDTEAYEQFDNDLQPQRPMSKSASGAAFVNNLRVTISEAGNGNVPKGRKTRPISAASPTLQHAASTGSLLSNGKKARPYSAVESRGSHEAHEAVGFSRYGSPSQNGKTINRVLEKIRMKDESKLGWTAERIANLLK